MAIDELELEHDCLLEMELGSDYIGSAFSPQVEVTDTDTGHEVAITYEDAETGITTKTFDVADGTDGATGPEGPQGPKGETGATGPQGEDGADGFSPTVSVQPIEGGHKVTITDAQGAHTFDVMDGEGGGGTDSTTKSQVAQLWGNQLTKELTGEVLTAADAYAAPPMALTVDGRSTQDGTPTPDAPVEIVSVEQVTLHASADGTTDAANWPVLLNLTHALRSLPNGTHDTLSLTYLRPSTREGWAWYGGEVTRRVHVMTLDGSESWGGDRFGCYHQMNELMPSTGSDYSQTIVCDQLKAYPRYANLDGITGISGYRAYSQSGANWLYARVDSVGNNATAMKAWLAEHRPTLLYKTNEAPTTETIDPIELPILPAPDVTVWGDPITGLQMRYVRDTNLAFAQLEAALADLATS